MLEFIKERYKNFEVNPLNIPNFNECVEIVNPYGKENITVYYHPESELSDFTVKWVYREHIDSKEDVIKEIDKIINETEAYIAFYEDDELRMGASIKTALIANLTLDTLSRELKTYNDLLNTDFSVRSFSGKYDMYGRIEKVDGKYTLISE
jgi:hypothetical protein